MTTMYYAPWHNFDLNWMRRKIGFQFTAEKYGWWVELDLWWFGFYWGYDERNIR